MKLTSRIFVAVLALAPATVYGRSTGAPTQRAGVPADGGLACTACHTTFAPVNSDPTGKLVIQAAAYTPGVKQKIKVQLTHPTASRWGFELTARMTSDETQPAGRFEVSSGEMQIFCGNFPGSAAACTDTSVQFVTHTPEGTHAGTSGGSTWEVDWTPPATDVGEVVFYAAGNAANGNRNNQGDHIYTARVRIPSAAGCPVSGTKVNAVVNSASYLPGMGFNEMFTIFGAGFAAPGIKRAVEHFDFVDDRFPREFTCVTVEVDGAEVPIVYVDENQINAQAPSRVFTGPMKVEVKVNKGKTREAKSEMNVQMQQFAPAFFVFGSSKSIAAQHGDFSPVADNSVVQSGTPAKPGETITLYGTGFGVTEPVWQAGERPTAAAPVKGQFTVTIGGVTLRSEDVSYVGLSPNSISGLYQVNARIPDSTPDGDQPVVLRMGGVATQDGVTIPVKK